MTPHTPDEAPNEYQRDDERVLRELAESMRGHVGLPPEGVNSHLGVLGWFGQVANQMERAQREGATVPSSPGPLRLTSPDLVEGGELPSRYTERGYNESPELLIDGIPTGAVSMTLTMKDLDAGWQDAEHLWLVWNIPPRRHLPGRVSVGWRATELGVNARQGRAWRNEGYSGPNVTSETRHRIEYRLNVLDRWLDLGRNTRMRRLEAAQHGHVIDTATLTTYTKTAR